MVEAAATIASIALPPSHRSTDSAACAASECGATAMPRVACVVFNMLFVSFQIDQACNSCTTSVFNVMHESRCKHLRALAASLSSEQLAAQVHRIDSGWRLLTALREECVSHRLKTPLRHDRGRKIHRNDNHE